LGKSNQAARKGTGPSKLATQKSNKENAIHAQRNIQNKNIQNKKQYYDVRKLATHARSEISLITTVYKNRL